MDLNNPNGIEYPPISKEITDKAGRQIKIFNSTKMSFSPAFTYMIRLYADIVDKGWTSPEIWWDEKQLGIIYAQDNNKIVGCISYCLDDPNGDDPYIVVGGTSNDYQSNGIYKAMHTVLEEYVKASGKQIITTKVHVKNKRMRDLSEFLNKSARYIEYYTVLK
jgi:RimJ/RimL family protein N-acetyltransferase